MEVDLAAEVIFNIGLFHVTNSLLTSWLVMIVLIGFAYVVNKSLKARKISLIQNATEAVIEGFYSITSELANEKAKVFFPIVMTFFIFIAIANLAGLLPGFGTIGLKITENNHSYSFVPLLRSINSDLNTTLALAICSLSATHFFTIKFIGLRNYLKKFFSLNPVFLFIGILELISEATKLLSLSFRLFGNIFAGEALITTISSISGFLVPVPFMMLEVIVGLVQATVFMMLTLVFMIILSQH